MKTKTMALACMLLAGGLTLNVSAQGMGKPQGPPGEGRGGGGGPGGMGGPGGPGGMEQIFLARIVNNEKAVKELGLSDAQVQTLRNGIFDLQEQKVKVKAEMEIAGIQQARLLTEDTIDEKAVMAAVEKTGAVRTEMAKLDVRGLLLVHSTLSADQRTKLREMIHHRMEQQRGEGGRGGFEGRGDRGQRGPGRGQDMHHRPDDGQGPGPEAGEPPPGDEPPPGEEAE